MLRHLTQERFVYMKNVGLKESKAFLKRLMVLFMSLSKWNYADKLILEIAGRIELLRQKDYNEHIIERRIVQIKNDNIEIKVLFKINLD